MPPASVPWFSGPSLQASQPAVETALGDPVVSASLWAGVAIMGFTTLLFVFLGRDVEDETVRRIFVATIAIPAISTVSYLGLATGLTVAVVEVGGRRIVTTYGRYITWTFSTPMILLAIGLLAGARGSELFAVVVADVAMCLTGLAAAFTESAVWHRWAWFAVSSVFFGVVLYVLLVSMPVAAASRGGAVEDLFDRLKTLTAVLWVGYPVVWVLGTEGLAVVGLGATSVAYTLLDVGAKAVFGYLLLSNTAAHDRVREVAGPARPAAAVDD